MTKPGVSSRSISLQFAHRRLNTFELRSSSLRASIPCLRFTTNTRPSASHVCQYAPSAVCMHRLTSRSSWQTSSTTLLSGATVSVREGERLVCRNTVDRLVPQVSSCRPSSLARSRSASASTSVLRSSGIRGTKECVFSRPQTSPGTDTLHRNNGRTSVINT